MDIEKVSILLVEDDDLASELLYDFLIDRGFAVTAVFTATDAVSRLKNEHFDLLILDINLPDFSGYEVLKSIKNRASLPAIVTSAYNTTEAKLLAFKYGASDYMVKPLDLEELEARIWIHLGRNSEIRIGERRKTFEIQGDAVLFKRRRLSLTTIEFEILSILVSNINRIVEREELLRALSSLSSPRSLDNHIKNIRKKIGDNGSKATYLKTVYGVGYLLRESKE